MGDDFEGMTSDEHHGRTEFLRILKSLEFTDKENKEWMQLFDAAHIKFIRAHARFVQTHAASVAASQKQAVAKYYKKTHPNYVPGLYNGKKPWTRLIQGKSYCVSCGRLVQYKPINCSAEQHHAYYEKILKRCNERNRRRKK